MRRRYIIIKGLPLRQERGGGGDAETLKELMLVIGDFSFVHHYRLKSALLDRPPLLKVICATSYDGEKVLAYGSTLKNSRFGNCFVLSDLTKKQQEKHRQLLTLRFK
eukprot:GHVN01029349.1.p1 GENE.GHVN01029349.1~~GHVN01029349.1.p1  ORF type:complete len:107 (+),score=9.50 GHVN01029349.1:639-959(+)